MNDEHDKPAVTQTGDAVPFFVLTIALTALGDWLFYSHPLGWTVGIYGAVLLIVVSSLGSTHSSTRVGLLLAILTAALCLRCIYEPNTVSVLLLLLGLVTLALQRREGWIPDIATWLWRWLHFFAHGLPQGGIGLGLVLGSCVAAPFSGRTSRALRLWSLPVVLGGVFLCLFAIANPVISRTLADLWHQLTSFSIPRPSYLRVLFWAVTAIAIAALLGYVSGIAGEREGSSEHTDNPRLAGMLPPAVIIRALTLFNLLFAVQTILDIYYLWGGAALPEGLTYASYAHRGAYVLILTALLAGLFALVAFRSGVDREALRLERKLVYLWLAQNVFLVVSSGWRLWLYVDVYSLTRMRVAAALWMLLVALGLLWIVVLIALDKSSRWLLNVNAVSALAVLYLCAFTGTDAHIASFNVRHCAEILGSGHKEADVDYLRDLGVEALPALNWLNDQRPTHTNAPEWRAAAADLSKTLDAQLTDWRGWTMSRASLLTGGRPAIARVERGAVQSYSATNAVSAVRPKPSPSVSTAAVPVFAETTVGSGRIAVLRPGRITIRHSAVTGGTFTNQDYSVARSAELRGLSTLSDLRTDQRVTFRYILVEGRPTIIELSVPVHNPTDTPW